MLYGANGYTGQIIAEVAARRGISPILAGRNRQAVSALANSLSMDYRVFDLEDLSDHLEGVSALLLAAGPFVHTSAVAIEACLAKGVHYLDITGEIGVFEAACAQDEAAKKAGIVLLPGVGFDVVPSDCLAASLAKKLPSATHLQLAFSGGELSRGTAKTMVTHLGSGGAIRKEGMITPVPMAFHDREIPFHDKSRLCMTIPWGDVSTAYVSTGIKNIRVYTKSSAKQIKVMRKIRKLTPLLNNGLVQRGLLKLVEARVKGPDQEARSSRKTELWGEVSDAEGRSVSGTLTTPEGYRLTAECAVESVERIAEVSPGFQTPSKAFGASYIESFSGCTLRV